MSINIVDSRNAANRSINSRSNVSNSIVNHTPEVIVIVVMNCPVLVAFPNALSKSIILVFNPVGNTVCRMFHRIGVDFDRQQVVSVNNRRD